MVRGMQDKKPKWRLGDQEVTTVGQVRELAKVEVVAMGSRGQI